MVINEAHWNAEVLFIKQIKGPSFAVTHRLSFVSNFLSIMFCCWNVLLVVGLTAMMLMLTTAQIRKAVHQNPSLDLAPKFTVKPALWRLQSPTPPKGFTQTGDAKAQNFGSPQIWRPQSPTPAPKALSRRSEPRPQIIAPRQDDLDQSASGYGHHHGRVHIKVFRGPDDHHDHFAPHGYWVKQPADDGREYGR